MKYGMAVLTSMLLVMILFSCKKPTPKGENISTNLKTFFDYQPGSYWVFRDSLNGTDDSVFVHSYINYPAESGEPPVNESININMAWFAPNPYGYTVGWYLGIGPYATSLTVDAYQFDFTGGEFPLDTGKVQNIPPADRYTDFLSQIILNGITYYDIYRIRFAYSSTPYGDTFFINQNQGFLAVLLNNPSVHTRLFLKKYSIIK